MANWSINTAAVSAMPALMLASGSVDAQSLEQAEDVIWQADTLGVASTLQRDLSLNSSALRSGAIIERLIGGQDAAIGFFTSQEPSSSTYGLHLLEKDGTGVYTEIAEDEAARLKDATVFRALLQTIEWRPAVWSDDAEIVFEWMEKDKHAVVSIEGDGRIGYALLKGSEFVSGELPDPPVSILPPDLKEYLTAV